MLGRTVPIVTVVAVLVVYVLSYAPVVAIRGGWTTVPVRNFNGRWYPIRAPLCGTTALPIYRPVDWLIMHTPLERPLFAWAALWGVESEFREAAALWH